MRFFIKLTLAFFLRFKEVIFASIVVGLIIFSITSKLIPYLKNSQPLRVGVTGRYSPESLPDNIMSLISKGLTTVSEDGRIIPNLATWETPDKGRTWVFELKSDLYWQDLKKFTTEDINYEFSDVEIVRNSDSRITFKLKDPFIPFPSVVTKPLFKKGLLGLGEWLVTDLKLSGNFVHQLNLENKSGRRVIYLFFPTEDATKTAFKLGKVDVIEDVLTLTPFDRWESTKVEKVIDVNQVVTLFFNTQDKFLGDKSVRQALIYAIDKSNFESRALGPISSNSWAYNPQVKEYVFDSERAREILEDVPDDVRGGVTLQLVTSPLLLKEADSIAREWTSLGIKTQVNVSSVVPSEFQTFLTILDLPTDPDQYALWHSTQTTTNISKYASPRIDKLLEDGRVELDFESRRKIYLDFQRFLLEDLPAGFLYNPVYYRISRK